MNDEPIKQQLDTYPPIRSFEGNTMRLITDEQHAQIAEALKADCGDRCNAEYNPCSARVALATLQALPEVEVVAKICHRTNGHASLWWNEQQALDRNEGHVFTPLYATKEPS